MELEGQVAVVTGAGRGIGRAIALELASMGADIVIAEVQEDLAEETAEKVRALGRAALPVRVDVSSRSDINAAVDKALAQFGHIDVLVNNAGVTQRASALDVTEELWDRVMHINALGGLMCAQAVLPNMVANKRGRIIFIASQSGKVSSATAWYTALARRLSSASPGRSRWHFLATESWSTPSVQARLTPRCRMPWTARRGWSALACSLVSTSCVGHKRFHLAAWGYPKMSRMSSAFSPRANQAI
jgi:hypothetical protein